MAYIRRSVLNKQTGSLSFAAGAATTTDSGNLTVKNSAFVRLRFGGMVLGGTDTIAAGVRLSVTIIDAVTVKVVATRQASNWSQTVQWELDELNPLLFKQVQRGTINLVSSPVAITAVVTTLTELSEIGSENGSLAVPMIGTLTFPDTTHVAYSFNSTETVGWQAVESR